MRGTKPLQDAWACLGGVPVVLLAGFSFIGHLTPAAAQGYALQAADPIFVVERRPTSFASSKSRAVTVFTREQIDLRNPQSVGELLSGIAGVHVDIASAGGTSSVYIRGAEPNYTLILLNGVPLNDGTDLRGGSVDLSSLTVEEIERVEVLKGASTSEFGQGAMAGTINIVTRQMQADGLFVRAGLGGQKYGEVASRFSHKREHWEVGAGASRLVDGLSEDGARVQLERYDGTLRIRSDSGAEAVLVARRGERVSRQFPESSGGVRLAASRELETRTAKDTTILLGGGVPVSDDVWLVARASAFQRHENRITPEILAGVGGSVPMILAATSLDRHELTAQATISRLPLDGTATLGLDGQRETGHRSSLLGGPGGFPAAFHATRNATSLFAQVDAVALSKIHVALGGRTESRDARRNSRSLGLYYEVDANRRIRTSWSEAYKSPSFFAIGDPLVGNPDLRDEQAQNVDLGFDLEGDLEIHGSAFRSRYVDLIDFDSATFRMVNRPAAKIDGGEIQVAAQLTSVARIEGSHTVLSTRLDEPGSHLRNRPRSRSVLALSLRNRNSSVEIRAVRVGRTFDFSVPTGEIELPGYTSVGISTSFKHRNWKILAAVDNLTNKRFESMVGFRTPGTRLRANLELAL